jgi:hypothetical protein
MNVYRYWINIAATRSSLGNKKNRLLYLKSKTAFLTSFWLLSKLVEQMKIRLLQSFRSFILKKQPLIYFLLSLRHARGLIRYKWPIIVSANYKLTTIQQKICCLKMGRFGFKMERMKFKSVIDTTMG